MVHYLIDISRPLGTRFYYRCLGQKMSVLSYTIISTCLLILTSALPRTLELNTSGLLTKRFVMAK